MKRFTFFVAILLLSISATSALADRWTEMRESWEVRRNGVLTEAPPDKVTKILVPDPGASAAEISSIIAAQAKKDRKAATDDAVVLYEKIDQAVDNSSGACARIDRLTAEDGPLTKMGADVKTVDGKIDGLTTKNGAITKIAAETKGLGDKIDITTLVVVTLIIVATAIIIGILLTAIRRSNITVDQKLSSIDQKVDNLPAQVAAETKKLEPITLELDIDGRHVSYTPPIVDGEYVGLFVPADAPVAKDPSQTVRFTHTSVGKLKSSVRNVMNDFLVRERAGTLDEPAYKQQHEIIRFAQATGKLTIRAV